ncbi:release factor glutamine methyltransferase [Lentilactobacillus fungorum]|uniref:Release factor glutamine methyltransferase n=1 Tax=Lentilactobacillus fungorum TaxID=2201250 RepID=A0ABQ3VZJ3_9LACO|nr:peptide chain release factor N(5)-glutamine methyltransferase [Lentilactobacillus fungorum]GHP14330.1 release factor glutamine methyltransferase [Lentilactobacillus fungorum]
MNNQVTFFEARKWASFRIKNQSELDMYDVDFILQHRSRFSATDLLIHYQQIMPAQLWRQFQADIEALLAGMPPQYIVHMAEFYGLSLMVNPAVLIPRIETEELVDWILNETSLQARDRLRILDIGTGSGAIALALKKQRPNWQVVASDISRQALSVAQTNAARLNVKIDFVESDVFEQISGQFDLIVSNPPYISTKETPYMDHRVLEHEPKLALYAAEDGLAIYKQLALGASQHLKSGGRLFIEIGFHQEQAVSRIFHRAMPAAQISTKHDTAGHQRMIQVRKGS